MSKKIFYNEITLMKVLATFFITWFHFKWSVPERLAPLFIGGAIGNSLFFYASGYLLKFKEEKFYGEWFLKKLIRLLPSLWVFYIVTIFLFPDKVSVEWYNFFYPTTFWFVNSIVCFFLVSYLLKGYITVTESNRGGQFEVNRNIFLIALIIGIVYVVNYVFNVDHSQIVLDEGGLKCWFYFFFFFWGYYDKLNSKIFKGNWISVLGFMCSIVLFFIYKKIGGRYDSMVWAQVVFVPLLLSGIVYFSRYMVNFMMRIPVSEKCKYVLSKISSLTLDIYIVQVFLINMLMPTMPFPINVIIIFIVILLASYVNNYLAERISNLLNYILGKL